MKHLPLVAACLLLAGAAAFRFIPAKDPSPVPHVSGTVQRGFDSGVMIGFQVGWEFVHSNIAVVPDLSNVFNRAYDLGSPVFDPRIAK